MTEENLDLSSDQSVDEGAFADFLRAHPDFFQRHPSLISQLVIPHPNTGRAISLMEKQVMVLRDQLDATQKRLRELLSNARANDRLGERVEALTLHLLSQRSADDLLTGIPRKLKQLFDLEFVVLLKRDHPALTDQITGCNEAKCLEKPDSDTLSALFGEQAPGIRSCALVPISRADQRFGLLALGSLDPGRYEPASGTRYLLTLQRLVSASLTQLDALAEP